MEDGDPGRPAQAGAEPSARVLLAYGAAALPLAFLTLPFYVLVPAFYAQGLLLPIAAVGQVLLAVRIVDAFSDPVIGALADRTASRFGRRRVWLVATTPLVALGAWQVFVPPIGAGLPHLAGWGTLLSVSWSAMLIPYTAWGAELSTSYAGRNRVTAFREGFTVVGTLVALSMPAVLPLLGLSGDRATLQAFAGVIALGLPLAVALGVRAAPEPVIPSTPALALADGLRHMRENRPFLRLLLAFALNGLANGLPATLFLFFVQERLRAPEAAGPLLVLYFACGVAGVPAWLALARRTSKHRAWCLGMLLACAAFVVAPFLGPGDSMGFAAVVVVTGLALGADVILPASIQADVIDVDTAASGQERAGLYLSIWALATKVALAGAVGIAFPMLGAFGFDPAAGLVTPAGLAALAWLYAGLPVLLKLCAIGVMWDFPLDEARQTELRRIIASRQARA
jgi:GPH family glycoside/pentoside/hexuronide:cation symporter